MKIAALTLACMLPAILALTGCGGGQEPMAANAVEWGYDGPGAPENWASLSDEYAPCAGGKQQSPVDITGYQTGDARQISFLYGGDAKVVRNDGKFVNVDYGPGNTLGVGQRSYELQSAHLHSPSEHRIDGASFAAELHLVHADADGNLAVVALLFGQGAPSPLVQAMLDAAPAAGETVSNGFTLNAAGYAPAQNSYYHYDGSKTTPPCHEPVGWYVMRKTATISPEQVENLLALSGGPNNRPVQSIGNRVIIIGGYTLNRLRNRTSHR
jgi:carbonic anhydrase